MSGEANETVLGTISTVTIATNIYKLKRLWNLTKDHPVERNTNSDGPDFIFGRNNHGFSVTIAASTPDLSTIDGWTDEGATGDLTELAIIVSFPPVGAGATVTASFNTKFFHSEMGHPSADGKILVRLDGVITSSTITWA